MTPTQDQWYKHASFQTDLRALLESPVLRTALEICRDQNLVPISTTKPVNLVDYFAIMGAKKEGYNEFLINLRLLAQPQRASVPATKPWEYKDEPETNTGASI